MYANIRKINLVMMRSWLNSTVMNIEHESEKLFHAKKNQIKLIFIWLSEWQMNTTMSVAVAGCDACMLPSASTDKLQKYRVFYYNSPSNYFRMPVARSHTHTHQTEYSRRIKLHFLSQCLPVLLSAPSNELTLRLNWQIPNAASRRVTCATPHTPSSNQFRF